MRYWSTALLSFLLGAEYLAQAASDHEDIWRRELDALSSLGSQAPRGVQKMSEDSGEKFWHQYWQFDELESSNLTSLGSPFILHGQSSSLLGRALFSRDASCPTTPINTSSCASIGHPDSCCPVGDTCILVTDTGNGPVGCCAAGATCGSTISSCDTASGYTSCPNSSNKGCCIPGYSCANNICVNAGTQTVVAAPSTTSSTSTTTVGVSVTTVTLTSASGFTTTATVFVTLQTTSTSDSAAAPVRPTTDSSTSTATVAPATVTTTTSTSTLSSSTTLGGAYCPTGYYQCSAVYLGGCCQVGRDCNTTTCPPSASTTLISGSATVVVASATASGCANGWYACPSSLGGNCCPTGYSCGQTDCPALITGAAAQNKEAPSEATGLVIAWTLSILALTTALGMVML